VVCVAKAISSPLDLGERSFDGYHPLSTMVRVD